MDDLVLNVKQIGSYPPKAAVTNGDLVLSQNGLGSPYYAQDFMAALVQARTMGGNVNLNPSDIISWGNGPNLSSSAAGFAFSATLTVPALNTGTLSSTGDIFVAGQAVAVQDWVTALFDNVVQNSVVSFNGRQGNVVLDSNDIRTAGGAPIISPNFGGIPRAPTSWDLRVCDNRIVTAEWVQRLITCRQYQLTTAGINYAFANSPPGVYPTSITPPLGDASTRIATTSFVDESLMFLQDVIGVILGQQYAPINSPAFTGVPSAPTAPPGTNTGQLATTSFVQTAIVASTSGVSSFNTRTGAVTLTEGDITAAGGAPIDSPNLVGIPLSVTAPVGTDTNQIATCAFVLQEVGATTAGVSTFNGRSGDVTLSTADVMGVGAAPVASPAFTGVPLAPTAAQTVNNTQIATTAYVRAAIAAAPGGVSSFNGRTGAITLQANDVSAVGGALLNSPAFIGTPTAPNPASNDNSQNIATTSWVLSRIAGVGVVSTWNGRAGAVTMTPLDIQNASGAIYRQSDTAPTQPQQTLWYNSLNGQLYVQYVDPVSSAQNWVVANSAMSPAPPAGSRVLIASQIVTSAVASVVFLYNFTNQYDIYELEIYNFQCATVGATLGFQASYDGTTFDTSATYSYAQTGFNAAGASINSGGSGQGFGQLIPSSAAGTSGYTQYSSMCTARLQMPWTTDRFKLVSYAVTGPQSGAIYNANGYSGLSTTNAWQGFRLLMTSGNITRGVFNLYGIVKAGAGAN